MVYRAIGLMSGSSLDGLDIAFGSFEEVGGKWDFELRNTECIAYTAEWKSRLANAAQLSAAAYTQLDNDFGRYSGEQVNRFIEKNNLQHQVQIIASHGHTVFHSPESFVTAQLGNGAQIAALTSVNVVDQLRSLDVALGGQGAPIVPLGEKHLFREYTRFLNLGGIANISLHDDEQTVAFDICVANQALNYFAQKEGQLFDENGALAESGKINTGLLTQLNALPYYKQAAPKSLSNQYFQETLLPLIQSFESGNRDILRTYTEHIVAQIAYGITGNTRRSIAEGTRLLATGGGVFNQFLMRRLSSVLEQYNIELTVPEQNIVNFKEAVIMAFLGVLRWREENTVLNITGASRPGIGGAVWIGQEY